MTRQVVSLISICFCFAAYAQKAKVELSASSTSLEVGETVAFKIKSNIQGMHQIDNIPVTFINSGGIGSTSYTEMDLNTGNIFQIYINTETGVFTKPGTYKIGPAYITSRSGKAYQSNTITVNVSKKVTLNNNGQVTAQQLRDPAFGVIQCNKTSIYEGESVVVGAKVYARFQPTRIGNYNSFIQRKGIEFQALTNTTRQLKIHDDEYKGRDYFSFEYDRNLMFPPGTGVFILEPFSMDLFKGFGSFALRSSGATIHIKPLPSGAPNDFIGAVGEYTISRTIDTNRVKQGDVFKLTVEIKGIGNIQNSLEPKLSLPKGFVVYGDPIVTKDIAYGVNGAEGVVSYEYNIQASNKGKINIPGTSISYFNPATEKYVSIVTDEHAMKVLEDPSLIAADPKTPTTDEAIYKQSAVDLRMKKQVVSTESIFGTPLFWSGVSAPIICAFFFLFLVRRREQSADEIESKQVIQRKDKELSSLMATSKSLLTSGDDDAFYSSVEHALRKAFECKMGITDTDRILSKQEIYDYLGTQKSELRELVENVFRTCEESRFGFGDFTEKRRPVYDQLESILNAL